MAFAAGTVAILTVLIYNPGAVPPHTLSRAEKVATAILEKSGVTLAWREARAADAVPLPSEVPLHFLATRPPGLHRDAEGFAVLQHEGVAPSYGGISYPAVRDIADWTEAPIETVLGVAMAHEIGHVLLGSGAHSQAGVMTARIGMREIAAAGRGELLFTPAEALALRTEATRRSLGSFRK
jgi:hypothetical protein